MIADIILLAVGLTWVIAAAVSDIRSREVPDWISFSLIGLGLGIRLIHSLVFSDWVFFLYGLAGLCVGFLVGALFYYAHVWGGGDYKLLVGLGAIFGTAPFFLDTAIPFFVILIVNILIFGAIYGLIWSSVLFFRNRRKVFENMFDSFKSTAVLRYLMIVCAIVALALTALMQEVFTRMLLVALAVGFVLYYFLFVFIRALEKAVMCHKVPVSQLTVGDWVAEPVKVHGKVISGPRDYGLELEQIALLKKYRVKSVLIKDGMAFVPAFALGLLFSLLTGKILLFLF